MLKSVFVDYNPVALLLNQIVTKVPLIADLSDHVRRLLFNKDDAVLQKLLFLLGIATITYKAGQFVHNKIDTWGWSVAHLANKGKATPDNLRKRYGNCYVCITGFTDGIGKGYAQVFAQYGFNLLLIGRNEKKVDRRIQQLRQNYKNIDIKYFVADLANFKDINNLQKQFNKFSDLDIGILINNAGSVAGGPYLSIEPCKIIDDINVDLVAVFVINRILIPRMRARSHKSAIINIASCTGVYLSTRVGVYSSGKKSLDIYSRILALENSDKIDILSLTPFGVSTAMMKMKKGPFMITPRQCVIGSLQDLLGGLKYSFGHMKHKLSSTAFHNLSEQKRFELFQFLWSQARKQAEP